MFFIFDILHGDERKQGVLVRYYPPPPQLPCQVLVLSLLLFSIKEPFMSIIRTNNNRTYISQYIIDSQKVFCKHVGNALIISQAAGQPPAGC